MSLPERGPKGGPGQGAGEDYVRHVAHELRASLNNIVGWVEVVKGPRTDRFVVSRAAETIVRQARQQLWLLTDLMDTWRLLSGTLRLNVAPVNIGELVSTAVEAIEPLTTPRNITIKASLGPVRGQVPGDRERLRQALVMLLSNAASSMPSGGVVQVTLVAYAETVCLTIRDRGWPVAPSALPYLFERAAPHSDPRCRRRHLGSGLSLTRDIVELHGGRIRALSNGRRGVMFEICLPFEASPMAVTRPAAEEPDRRRLAGLNVLLVDDEPDARDLVGRVLSDCGAEVLAAASARDAWSTLRHGRVHVLVTDINMPDEDGYALIRRVRAADPVLAGLPAAALTAFTSDEDRRRILQAGFQVHLSKPVDRARLVDAIEQLARCG